MKVWVLRHGEAQSRARSDAERELTAHGREEVLKSALHLSDKSVQRIIASPYVRAQQTAELVRQSLGVNDPVVTVPWLTPDSSPREVLLQLDKLGVDEVLLVSHQPLVGELIGVMAHGSPQQAEPMSTASLAELEGEFVLAGAMQLNSVRHV
ncbi:phosphohistidine phosphatase [Pseudomonas amygdali pv. tabaci str. ATCC 11528]|uniref:Phosphohistidine phosphatase SixA n=2 Tax=Pseudomonas amygdali pv. lachrymans TaxID=53707 RepID=A0AB37R1I8_PSEAV|nr:MULTISPECIES: phosphohistidine phosphatase SixA [Pseudomonas syringae group]ARA81704.1 phosphohistidine phosphatase SixA [Pseudomonas amygdali pv. lachrymans]AXH55357.1 phosphohistidine phosphatase SixA [Pseudomonas amygdali pv. lachrymans str. M301315]KEZ65159.1 phosphohistidine phosphatase [Pseudomonas amygdali pv. tabaci str. ATCC 11528]KKY54211.1 phosphohistidine phosphatase [Pseudomonas amygdali pv. tabaci str. ATCC 11528]KKY59172.1 phosphohistidine phosphatase [Pseudomonas amygdali pv